MAATKQWAVLYLRPDGWWIAGEGFPSRSLASECARGLLPESVRTKVVAVGSEEHRAAVEREASS